MRPPNAWCSPEVLDQILELGRDAAPDEACGIITPDLRVVSLPNATPNDSESSYAINNEDLVEAISEYIERSGVEPQSITRAHFIIWHTHPSGLIGPSHGDMVNRVEGFQYVVVALPNGEASHF
jgi:proteasome lid subunit RPN8/RPN11